MKLKSFRQHINEAYEPGDEKLRELRRLGLAEPPVLADRIDGLENEWGSDPEIEKLVSELKSRTGKLIYKWFPVGDPTDNMAFNHYQEYIEHIGDLGSYDTGLLEVLVNQEYDG